MTDIEKYVSYLIDLVFNKDDLDQILFDLAFFGEKIGYGSSPKTLTDSERKNLVRTEAQNVSSEELRNFFQSLIDKKDFWLFEPTHFKVFSASLTKVAKEVAFFNVVAAIQLKPEDIKALAHKLSKKMERKVVIDLVVDESIIAGAIIKKENYILDYSLKSKLNNLGKEWKQSIEKEKVDA